MPALIVPRRTLQPPQFNGPIVMDRDSWQGDRLAFWQAGILARNLAQPLPLGTPTSVTWGVDRLGMASSYPADGSSHLTSYADANEYDFTTAMTVAAWVWTGAIPYTGTGGSTEWFGTIAKKDGNYALRRAEFAAETNIGSTAPRWSALWWQAGGNLRQLTSAVVPVANTMSHVAMVINGDDIEGIYVDGVETVTPRIWITPGRVLTNPLEIGGSAGGFNETFGGLLWDVRVYSYAMSDGEIRMLYDPVSRWDLYASSLPSRVFFDMGTIVRRFLLVR